MRIGLQVPSFTFPGGAESIRSTLCDVGRCADDSGFHSLWVMDHFFQIPLVGAAEMEMMEGYSTLSYLAAITSRLKLGTMVTGITYRHPGVLAKTVTTLDVLSGGRAYLGVGAAWFQREHVGLGVPFPPLGERFERLEETLQIVKQMWSGQAKPFEGTHYRLAETLNSPQVLGRPHPPILIGGLGEKKTLRLVAQYGDACNLFAFIGIDELRRKLDVLRSHCERLGRRYEEIEKTTLDSVNLAPGGLRSSDVVKKCQALAAIGIDQAIFNMPQVETLRPLELIGKEVIPEVSAL